MPEELEYEFGWDMTGFYVDIEGDPVKCDEMTEEISKLGDDVEIKKTTSQKIGGDDDVGRTESVHRG